MKNARKSGAAAARRRKPARKISIQGPAARLLRMAFSHFGVGRAMDLWKRLGYEAC